MKTVNLVATIPMVQRYFPGTTPRTGYRPDVMSADFPIAPERCKTALGRWLAEKILTTRFDDDASRCVIAVPATELGLHFRSLAERLMQMQEIRSAEEAERSFEEIERWLEKTRRIAKVYGSANYKYRTFQFQWPVFGSLTVKEAVIPEDYFDACARKIRVTGGVIVAAGLDRESPPESITCTLAANRGTEILRQYKKAYSKSEV